MSHTGEKMNKCLDQQHQLDCSALSATDLRRRYPAEANSHRNLMQRAKNQGRTVHPDFLAFRDFLTYVGPRPCPGATLDRIDNSDPEYAPGKVRWADKRTQNSNKGDTLIFYYSRTGETYTTARLAALRKVRPSAIRKRRERGWSDDEIIEGKRHTPGDVASPVPPANQHWVRSVCQPPRPKTVAEINFERNAAYAAYCREVEGEEWCLPEYEDIRQTGAEVGVHITRDNYERHFARCWRNMGPHVIRNRLPEWARELVAKIEGKDFTEIKRQEAELRDSL